MNRETIIKAIYRSLRDAYNKLNNVEQKKNTITFELEGHQVEVNFRIKFKKSDRQSFLDDV